MRETTVLNQVAYMLFYVQEGIQDKFVDGGIFGKTMCKSLENDALGLSGINNKLCHKTDNHSPCFLKDPVIIKQSTGIKFRDSSNNRQTEVNPSIFDQTREPKRSKTLFRHVDLDIQLNDPSICGPTCGTKASVDVITANAN
jgi:hypothetical protein